MNEVIEKNKTVEITGYSHDVRGLANLDGKVHFVSGALQGEQATLTVTRKHPSFNEAIADQITNPSQFRVQPKCAHFGVCGGCKLQFIDPKEQIRIKQIALLDQLQRTAKVQPNTILLPVTGPNWQYRHKARLGVKYVAKKERVLIGFRELNGRYVADIKHCTVLHPSIGDKLESLSLLIASLTVYQHVPQLEIAVGDDTTVIIVRHLKPLIGGDIEKLKFYADTEKVQIYLQAKGPDSVTKLWPMVGPDRLYYALDGLTMAFHPNDFTQVNPYINRKMVALAIELLQLNDNDTVLDLFCGLGNFSLPIANRVQHVVGVEGSQEMVQRSGENARNNQIENAEFFTANLFESVSTASWASAQYDKLLIDPPRSGALEVVSMLSTWQPERIVYVSCNPATLARDTAEIIDMGYTLDSAGVLDMFPHTNHVESIALFIKK